jgi:hypothetical protein
MIFLISTSQIARITSMSHQHLASFLFELFLKRRMHLSSSTLPVPMICPEAMAKIE